MSEKISLDSSEVLYYILLGFVIIGFLTSILIL